MVLRGPVFFHRAVCCFSAQDCLTAAELIRWAPHLPGYRYFFVRRRTKFGDLGDIHFFRGRAAAGGRARAGLGAHEHRSQILLVHLRHGLAGAGGQQHHAAGLLQRALGLPLEVVGRYLGCGALADVATLIVVTRLLQVTMFELAGIVGKHLSAE
jgi:hypothetical protein